MARGRVWVPLAANFYVGTVSRFDLGNALVIVLYSGTLETVADINSTIMQTARFYFREGAALMALAAVILGETSLFGGRGIIFAGSLLIGTINNGRIIIGLDISEQMMVAGGTIILAVAFGKKPTG